MTERGRTTTGGMPTETVTERERRHGEGAAGRAIDLADRGVKPGFLTSEFLASIIAAIGILIAAAVADNFDADEAWRLIAFLAIGYMVSRGLAKLGAGWRSRDVR